MPRQKKDGEKVSLFLDRSIMEAMRELAAEKGQTLTVAIERALKAFLEDREAENHNKSNKEK